MQNSKKIPLVRTRVVALAALILSFNVLGLLSSGCNTTEGVGKDIKAAGKGIENAAQDAK